MTRAASYALPVLRTTMGIDPVDTITSIALLQSSGISSTKAGTWLNSAELGLMPGTKIMTGTTAARHMEALKTLGLVDDKGKSLFMNTQGQFMAGAAMGQMIKGLQSIPHDQWAAIFQSLAGTQGSRFLAIMTDPVVAQRGAQLLAGASDYAARQGSFWDEYGAGSPAQDTRTALAEFTRSVMDLSGLVLPAFTQAMDAATKVLTGVRSVLEGAGVPGAGSVTSWATVGGAAYLLSSRVRAGVSAAARLGGGAAARLGVAGALPWLGAAGAAAGLGYLDYSLYDSIQKKTGAPWYSFIPGAEFFGADPWQYQKSHAASGGGNQPSSDNESFFGSLVGAIENALHTGLNGVKVVLDGEVIGHLISEAQAAESRRPPSGPSDFDGSQSPMFPGYP